MEHGRYRWRGTPRDRSTRLRRRIAGILRLQQDRRSLRHRAVVAGAAEIEASLGKPISAVFESFEREPVASASVAQVHIARLKGGTEVAVKVLRPGIEKVIARDVKLMDTAAGLVERLWADFTQHIPCAAQIRQRCVAS